MKVSTKGRYGLEAIVDLAIHGIQGCVNIKSIAARCEISEAYVLQIFLELRRAGIIDSIRGAQGGYVLAKDPAQITVNMVLTALEGKLAPVPCLANSPENFCDYNFHCATRGFWETIMDIVCNVTESITIADLVECYHQFLAEDPDIDYYI